MRKLALFLVLFVPYSAGATNYFVSTSGSDSNNCSSGSPCLTIQHGISVASGAGNTLSVGAGTYTEDLTISSGGSSGNNFIIQGFAISGSCTENASSDSYTPEGTHPAPTVKVVGHFAVSTSNVSILCFEITPNNSETDGGTTFNGPVGINGSGSGEDFEDNYIHKNGALGSFGGGNVFTDAINCGGCSSSTIKHNYMVRAAANQIWAGGTNNTYLDNEEYKGETHNTAMDMDYNQVGGSGNTYKHNYMHGMDQADCDANLGGCHVDCLENNVGPSSGGSNHDQLFDGNVCFNQNQGLFWEDGSSSTYGSYSYIYNNTAINNVFAFGPSSGVSFWSCTEIIHAQVRFDNNICWGTGASFRNGSQVTSFENNIMYQTYKTFSDLCLKPYGSDIHNEGGTASTFLTNQKNILYEDTTCTVGTSGPNVSYSNDIRNTSPLWVNPGTYPQTSSYGNFYLSQGSPAVAAGSNLFSVFTDYKDGTTRANSAFDIGPLPVQGTNPAVSFSCNPNGLSFGNVNVNASSSPQTCTLTNTGNATLTVTANGFITGTQYSFTSDCGAVTFNLTASSACHYTVTFSPTTTGTLNDTFSITDNATGSPHTFPVTGTGVNPNSITLVQTGSCNGTFSSSGTNCTFNANAAGDTIVAGWSTYHNSTNDTVTMSSITNNSNDIINCSSSSISKDTSTNHAMSEFCYVTNIVGGETTWTIKPSVTTGGSIFFWEVRNVSSVDQIAALNYPGTTSSTPSGAAVTTTQAAEMVIGILDTHGQVSGMFSGNSFTSDSLLNANGWAHQITSSTGTYTPRWQLNAADTYNGSTISFSNVSGSPPNVQFTPTGLSFPNTITGNTSAAQSVTLTNNGGSALTIASITLTGTDTSQFTAPSHNCPISPSTLAASGTCTITEQFAPTTTGAKSANISVADNASGSPHTASLAGTGIAAPAPVNLVASPGGVPIQ